MTEKTTLLPTAPVDDRFAQDSPPAHTALPMPKVIIVPGLEFDPRRKYRYGMHSLTAGLLLFVALVLVEMRDCNFGIQVDLDRLQALHFVLMVFALILYMMSLFGIADFIFKFKIFFLVGVLLIYVAAGLLVWTTYEAAVNPCTKSFTNIPVDFNFDPNKNVFSRGDVVGIIVLFLDIFATVLMFSAAANFYKRY